MADPNQGQLIATAWERKVGTKPEDQVYTSQFLINRLRKGKGFKGINGRLIEVTLEYAENTTFKSYDDLEALDTTRIDVFDVARYDWKQVAGTIVFSELEKGRYDGDGGKFDVQAAKLESGRKSMFANLNRQAYSDGTGNGSKDFGGLNLLVSTSPSTGTVGGINRATFSFWRNQQTSGAKTSTAFDNLRSTMRTVYNKCTLGGIEAQPDFWVTDRPSFEGYESLLTANERYTDKKLGDAGFDNEVLMFKGAPGYFDEDCNAGNLYFLNADYLKLVYMSGRWMKLYPPVEPANQTAEIYKLLCIGNYVVTNSRHLGVVSGIT